MIKKNIFKIFIILLLTTLSLEAAAACGPNKNRYWVAEPNEGEKWWHDDQNWSDESGGDGGKLAPTTKCYRVFFDGNSVVNAKIHNDEIGYTIRKLVVSNQYSGTIDLNGKILNSKENIAIYGGTLLVPASLSDTQVENWGSKPNMHTYGDLIIWEGVTVTVSGYGKIKVKRNVRIRGELTAPGGEGSFLVHGGFNVYSGSWGSGTFNHNNGTVTFSTKGTGHAINISGEGNFYNIWKGARKHLTLSTPITVENNLTNIGTGQIKAGSNNITIGGNLIFTKNNFNAGTGKVIFNGSSAQTISSAANFKHLQISNSNVSLDRAATVTGTLTIDSGATLDLNGYNLNTGTLVNNGNLQLEGSETVSITNPDTDSGTVTYDGTGTYTTTRCWGQLFQSYS